jgi:hypothetical protein|tara:strand:+ start:364 stop:474 length:111 start_codon:yes stop_codon:yes gene_type:complete
MMMMIHDAREKKISQTTKKQLSVVVVVLQHKNALFE